jgi:multiple sugar transport system ATP-binding protein
MSELTIQNITKSFGNITALKDISFSMKDGEFFVLLGPTGAGKTTTLRVIAGLEKPDSGHVLFNNENVDALTPADRDVAIVFQQYSLYPTMTVYENMAFPLRAPGRKLSEQVISEKINEAAEKLRITHLLKRKTAQLSGGEMQRVSIGRAIVRRPQVFLMDEPLSNLDAKLRESLRVEIKHLQKVEGITTLYVTHDQIEALTMADRIGILDHGNLVQVGTPDDIYDRPINTFVAKLVGTPRINLVSAKGLNGKCTIVGSEIFLPPPPGDQSFDLFSMGIRPEDITLSSEGEFSGVIALTEPLGVETIVHISNGEVNLISLVTGLIDLKVGEKITFNIKKENIHYFDQQGDRIS